MEVLKIVISVVVPLTGIIVTLYLYSKKKNDVIQKEKEQALKTLIESSSNRLVSELSNLSSKVDEIEVEVERYATSHITELRVDDKLNPVIREVESTKSDISDLKKEIRNEIKELREESRRAFQEHREDLREYKSSFDAVNQTTIKGMANIEGYLRRSSEEKNRRQDD